MNWTINLADGTQKFIQADLVGVANNGELLCFVGNAANPNQPPLTIMGWACNEWKSFARSNLVVQ